VKVIPEHQNYLCFLWRLNRDFTQELTEFKLILFGALGLCYVLCDCVAEQKCNRNVPSTLLKNLSLDNMLKSAANDNASGHLRGQLGQQRMEYLPADWVSSALSFTYCGVDMLGLSASKIDALFWRIMLDSSPT